MIWSPSMRLLLASLLLAAAACSDAPSKSDCEKLLDHLIDLEIKAGGGDGELSTEAKAELEKQKKGVAEFAAGQKFLETCREKMTKASVECGLAAKTAEDVAKCDESK